MNKIIFNIFLIALFVSFCENKTMNQANSQQNNQNFFQQAEDLLSEEQYEWLLKGMKDNNGKSAKNRIMIEMKRNSFLQIVDSNTRNNMR